MLDRLLKEADAKVFTTPAHKKLQRNLNGLLLPSDSFVIKYTTIINRGRGTYVFKTEWDGYSLSERDLQEWRIPGFETMAQLIDFMVQLGAKPPKSKKA